MIEYLEFRKVQCKDCYKCLRGCPVKAIKVINHQAQVMPDRCILCGKCISICPQNAKIVHSELPQVSQLLNSGQKIVASVAPAFVSSFGIDDFSVFKIALAKLGFAYAEETSVGAQQVVKQYKKLLNEGTYKNFITSACPAACQMIQKYYPKALKYLAPVDSPMIAHGKMLKEQFPDAKVVFIGPCIAKKREAAESDFIENVLTFEDLKLLFDERGIVLNDIVSIALEEKNGGANLSKGFPTTHGIIKAFDELPKDYEYLAVDGIETLMTALDNIESLDHVFLEINVCSNSCINGPCVLSQDGGIIKAFSDIRNYVKKELKIKSVKVDDSPIPVNIDHEYSRIRTGSFPPTEKDIESILHKTGKFKKEDELNCSACGYATCREKAWAVLNGYADIELCLPYMRKRAESMSYEIIHNNPQGMLVVDSDFNILDINNKAIDLLGIESPSIIGKGIFDFVKATEFCVALINKEETTIRSLFIQKTNKYLDVDINLLQDSSIMYASIADVTEKVNYDKQLENVREETIMVTDEVIKKQMRVAQEIASLLGETTAETKVALVKLKKMLENSGVK